ncbi:PepSY domain-containing protein [Marivibrio halodurans]|uniref:PepSY domain-containing protein n=1 Tax=Marivibrio halodurans TaxID=2039722 RepID=A0A8J7V058_9PROT|nr:PepSY domain-containing protein [Marivibrio halodurans]
MSPVAVKRWVWVHKWTSLICTVFMLLLCVTGLPLIFHDEIDAALEGDTTLPPVPEGTGLRTLDEAVAAALAAYPGERPLFLSFDIDRPVVNVTTGPRARSTLAEMHLTAIDLRTAEIIGSIKEEGIMHVILRLHVDMFAGLPGELFLGFMGLLLVVSIVSGVVVYAPFMRRLRFGTVRTTRSIRLKWLDLHNLIGIVTLMWLTVVAITGVINTLSTPLVDLWRADELAELTAPYEGMPLPESFTDIDAAVDTAMAAAPGMSPRFIAFPGVRFSTNHHYAVWLRGATTATERLSTPVLIDATDGDLTAVGSRPWYMTALGLSQPLHFGDYGGLPLKILWAVLDILAIVLLGSGVYLWAVKRSGGSAEALVARRARAVSEGSGPEAEAAE